MTPQGLFAAVVLSAVALASAGGLAWAATPSTAAPASPTARSVEKSASPDVNKETAAPDEAADARNAARTRMRECGHQWSTMKKSGAANGMTWKDFSQGCLARK